MAGAEKVIRKSGAPEPQLIAGLLVIVAALLAFLLLAGQVREGSLPALDEAIIQSLRDPDRSPRGPVWLEEIGRDATALGSHLVLLLVTGAVLGFLLIERKYRTAGFVLAATSGAAGLSLALKWLFDRGRPDEALHRTLVYTSSFPSGHAMLSVTVYLTLGVLLATLVRGRVLKVYLVAVALLLSALVGASRVYLGVHYPTDVLAGWAAGLVWATLCAMTARQLQRRRTIEQRFSEPARQGAPPS